MIELYGEGLERIFARWSTSSEGAAQLRDRLAGDGVVASLMLIHGLYPVGLDERVVEALDSVRPYMESHGGNVELLGIDDGIATDPPRGQLRRLPGLGLDAGAGDQVGARRGGARPRGPRGRGRGAGAGAGDAGRRARPSSRSSRSPTGGRRAADAGSTSTARRRLGEGELTRGEVDGVELLVARVEGNAARLSRPLRRLRRRARRRRARRGDAACPACERRFFLPRAGRSLDDDRLLLEPVPLLDGAGRSRVALPRWRGR